MTKEYYKILSDNLGEYTIVDENNVLIVTELEHKIHAEVICEELNNLRNENESIVNENKRLHKTIKKQTMALCDFHNRETAIDKWGDKRPEFNLDKYYEVCMEEVNQVLYPSDVQEKIKGLISECEKGIDEIIESEKDSYIVKHDIAIKMLKKLAKELKVEL